MSAHHLALIEGAKKRVQAAEGPEREAFKRRNGTATKLAASKRMLALRTGSAPVPKAELAELIQADQLRVQTKSPLKLPYPTDLKLRLQQYVDEDEKDADKAAGAYTEAKTRLDLARAALSFEQDAPSTGCPELSTKCPLASKHKDKCAKVDLTLPAKIRKIMAENACNKTLPMFAGVRGLLGKEGLALPV